MSTEPAILLILKFDKHDPIKRIEDIRRYISKRLEMEDVTDFVSMFEQLCEKYNGECIVMRDDVNSYVKKFIKIDPRFNTFEVYGYKPKNKKNTKHHIF